MAKHDNEDAFYRTTTPALRPELCVHNGGQYHNRFGDVLCDICHTIVGWHPDLVRPGVFGLCECDYHGEIMCDCGTTTFRIERLDRIIGNDAGKRSLRIGQKYLDDLEGEPWPLSEIPDMGELTPLGVDFRTLD